MQKLKSHKTVEQIAKKHRLEVSFVQNQLDMGEPIEHEHTQDHDLAKYIALQHLDEIPDYYTRLKKMEADAKRHHKKFKDVKEETKSGDEGLRDWFGKSKSSDGKSGWVQLGGKWAGKPCARQEGQTSTPKCGSSKMKRALSKDEEEAARRRKNIQDPNQPQKTGGTKPTNVRTEEMDLQEVKDKPGKGSGKKDACYNKVKSRYDVWPSAYASGALVKCRKVGAANWGESTEQTSLNYDWDTPVRERPDRYCPKCEKLERRDECRYGPKYWDMFSLPAEIVSSKKDYNTTMPHPANEAKDHEHSMARSEISTVIAAAKRLRGKLKGEGNIEAWVQSKITKAADYLDSAADYLDSGEHDVEESCWVGYKKVGMKKKGKKIVPNCVPESVSIEDANGNHYVQFIDIIKPEPLKASKGIGSELLDENEVYSNWRKELSEDWQKVNRQDKTDGLSQSAVKAYRRENPGSKLQTAVTEKNPTGKRADRRKNFCSRMSGMKSKLTSAKTSRDPDSRINKALRRWNCN